MSPAEYSDSMRQSKIFVERSLCKAYQDSECESTRVTLCDTVKSSLKGHSANLYQHSEFQITWVTFISRKFHPNNQIQRGEQSFRLYQPAVETPVHYRQTVNFSGSLKHHCKSLPLSIFWNNLKQGLDFWKHYYTHGALTNFVHQNFRVQGRA